MLTNALIFLCLVAITALIAWAVLRAIHGTRPAVRWTSIVVGGLLGAILVILSAVSARGLWTLYSPRGRAIRDIKVEATPERIARGRHIANTSCVGCHTLNGQLPLSGGRNLSDEIKIPLGDLYTINLTPAGPLANWTDGQIFRALRDGADERNRRLPVMSAQRVRNLSDEDILSVIAYLRSQPPVQHETPPPRPSYLAVVMAGFGMLPYLPGMAPDTIAAPAPGPTKEYGQYMVTWMGCDECHGQNLTGGHSRILPHGPNLRSVKGWTAQQFIAALRTGRTPFKTLDSLQMPWTVYGHATDDELTAIHAYLTSLD